MRQRHQIDELISIVEKLRGEKWKAFKDLRGDWGRDVVLWAARRYGGYKLRELAAEVGGVDYTAISMALKRLDLRAAHDRQLAQVMEQVGPALRSPFGEEGSECDK